jgi:hypothetical protein
MEFKKSLELNEDFEIVGSSMEKDSLNYNHYNVLYPEFKSDLDFIKVVIQNNLNLVLVPDYNEFIIDGIKYEILLHGDNSILHDNSILLESNLNTHVKLTHNKNNILNSYNLFIKLNRLVKFNEKIKGVENKITNLLGLKLKREPSLREPYRYRSWGDNSQLNSINIDNKDITISLDLSYEGYWGISVDLNGDSEVTEVSFLHSEGEIYYSGDEKETLKEMVSELESIESKINALSNLRKLLNLK